MPLSAILNTALTGLNVAQAALDVTSQNISNVNTPGYTRETVQQEPLVTAGQGTGVAITNIQSVTDQFLQGELQSSAASTGQYNAMNEIQNELQNAIGDPAQQDSIASAINQIFSSITELAADTTQQTSRSSTINAIQSFGNQIGSLASQIQTLRSSADAQIGQNVTTVNNDLTTIQNLNQQIVQATMSGTSTASLEDQRTQAVNEISGIIGINTTQMANGAIGISTTSGITLLDSTARQLVYTPAGTVTSGTEFNQITVNSVNPTSGVVAATGTPLDPAVQSGSLAGWLTMRDQELPALASELGQLSSSVANQLNAVSNAYTAVPPPASLTGRNSGLTAADLPGFTGQTTFYTTDSNNAIVQAVRVAFDTGTIYNPPSSTTPTATFTTLGDLTSAVTTALGGSGTLALNNGVMSFTATGTAAGVAIQQGSVAAGAQDESRGGDGFSQFFGMNDLVQTAAPLVTNTGFTTSSPLSFSGQTTLQLIGPANQVAATVTVNFDQPPLSTPGATFGDLLSYLNSSSGFAGKATIGLSSDGALTVTPASGYSGYQLEVGDDTSNRGGTGMTLGTLFGIGSANQDDTAQNFSVVSSIASNPYALPLASVDTTAAAGTAALNLSDNSGALALENVGQQTFTIPAAGNLAQTTTTLGGYAADFIGGLANDAANTQTQLTQQQSLQTALQQQASSVSGVNLDNELANMVMLQNAYNASGRVLTTVNQMLTALMQF